VNNRIVLNKLDLALVVVAFSMLSAACAVTRPEDAVTSQSAIEGYPAIIEATPQRRQSGNIAWRLFLAEHGAPRQIEPDLHPILRTPVSLPRELAGKIKLISGSTELTEEAAREALRAFIERQMPMLSGRDRTAALSLKDLSLVSFVSSPPRFSAVYQQMNFGYPLSGELGKLEIGITRSGELVSLKSLLVPRLELPRRPHIDSTGLAQKMVDREFTYSAIDGRPLTYKVRGADEVTVKDLVIYPKQESDRILLYLAYPVEVGRGTTWTVYVDAFTGNDIAVVQNFMT
jgi:hypothetical protein